MFMLPNTITLSPNTNAKKSTILYSFTKPWSPREQKGTQAFVNFIYTSLQNFIYLAIKLRFSYFLKDYLHVLKILRGWVWRWGGGEDT